MADKIGKFLTTRIIHHGPGALGKLDGEIGRSGATRVGIVIDRGVVEAGIVERVLAEVKAATFTFDEVQPDPSGCQGKGFADLALHQVAWVPEIGIVGTQGQKT